MEGSPQWAARHGAVCVQWPMGTRHVACPVCNPAHPFSRAFFNYKLELAFSSFPPDDICGCPRLSLRTGGTIPRTPKTDENRPPSSDAIVTATHARGIDQLKPKRWSTLAGYPARCNRKYVFRYFGCDRTGPNRTATTIRTRARNRDELKSQICSWTSRVPRDRRRSESTSNRPTKK